MTITLYTFFIAAVGTLFLSDTNLIVRTVTRSPGMLVFAILFGFVNTIIPYLLYTYGLNRVENGQASIIASVEPVAATVIGMVVFRGKTSVKWIHGHCTGAGRNSSNR